MIDLFQDGNIHCEEPNHSHIVILIFFILRIVFYAALFFNIRCDPVFYAFFLH